MTTPSDDQGDRRRAGGLILGSALLSAVAVGGLAYTATNAAFSGITGNTGNDFTAATVTLIDDDFGGTNLTLNNMIPGDTSSGCIEVTYTGSTTNLAGLVLYGTSSGALASDLTLTVTRDNPGAACGAAPGTPTVVYATNPIGGLGTDYLTGSPGFTPTATGQVVAYYFDVQLDPATPNAQQGATATADFTWEVRSN